VGDATSGSIKDGARSSSCSRCGTSGRAGSGSGCTWRLPTIRSASAYSVALHRAPPPR
jgi:hypothetical protein